MSSPLTKEVLQRAEICNAETPYLTNTVQSSYVLLLLNPKDYNVVYVTNNAEKVFGSSHSEIIGKNFLALLSEKSAVRLSNLLAQKNIKKNFHNRNLLFCINILSQHTERDAVIYGNNDYICVEIETDELNDIQVDHLDALFLSISEDISNYSGKSTQLANLVCHSIKEIIDYDLIWYCEFDENGDGYVSAEVNNGEFALLINHHFPSTDIPKSMHKVYANSTAKCNRWWN